MTDQEAQIIWSDTVDDRWLVKVIRTSDRTGTLVIQDRANEDKIIHEESVGLSYGAIFGPDTDDVASWQDRAIKIIDAL